MTAAAINVVFDVNVLVMAVVTGNNRYRSWPSPPPTSANPAADCLGVINDAAEFALWASPHILANTTRVICENYDWPPDEADAYGRLLVRMVNNSGGGTIVPPRTVHDCRDHEDNLVLDLATEVGAFVVVSDGTDLTSMSPWRGTPILRPREFANRVDAMRRHRRR